MQQSRPSITLTTSSYATMAGGGTLGQRKPSAILLPKIEVRSKMGLLYIHMLWQPDVDKLISEALI